MIVFDLKCSNAHVFEAWFGSSSDYETQQDRGLVSCPICGAEDVEKAVMAPAVGTKGNRRSTTPAKPVDIGRDSAVPVAGGDPEIAKAMLQTLADMQKKILDQSEYVGSKFADEARAIHHGEAEMRGIYGETTPEDAAALEDEGIDAMPLLFPVRPRGGDA